MTPKNTITFGLGLIAISGGCLLEPRIGWAQSAGGPPALEEVTVTARRAGAENVQNIPVAVSVLSTEQFDRQGFSSFSEFQNSVPSLSIQEVGPGQNKISMRGIVDPGKVDPTNLEDQALVSVYLDDTPISLQGATPDLKVFDLERVEVIRGPQGTLYGAGSMAGTIRFITRKPNLTQLDGYTEGIVSNTESGGVNYNLRGMLTGPLVAGQLGGSLSVYKGFDSGYIDNIGYGKSNANSLDTTQMRGALRYAPGGPLTADLSVILSDLRAGGFNDAYSDLGNGHDQYRSLTPESYRDRLQLYNLTLDYDLDWASLTSSTSYTDRHFKNNQSYEAMVAAIVFQALTPAPNMLDNRIHEVTEELRLTSKGTGPFKWITGLFYDSSKRRYIQNNLVPGLDNVIGVSSIDFNAPQENEVFFGDERLDQRQIAAFGEATYTVASKLDLTAGARYFNYQQTYGLHFGGVAGSLAPGEPLDAVGTTRETGVNPRAVASYHVSSDVIVFAEAARGFRYGGVNQAVPLSFCADALASQGLANAPVTFGPDKLWSYSLGEKSTLAGGRATLNASAFFIDWRDIQTNDQLTCGYYFTQNAGKVTSKGGELETSFRVTDGLTLSANASYTDASAAQAIPNLSAQKGDEVPYFPKYIASGSAQYRIPLGAQQSLTSQLSLEYRSSSFDNFSPLTRLELPSSTVLNGAMTYARNNWEVGLFGHNLTNEHVVTSSVINTFGEFQPGNVRYFARPRTVGVRLRVGF